LIYGKALAKITMFFIAFIMAGFVLIIVFILWARPAQPFVTIPYPVMVTRYPLIHDAAINLSAIFTISITLGKLCNTGIICSPPNPTKNGGGSIMTDIISGTLIICAIEDF